MNYLKSALAGFGMSFIGTALCGAKTGQVLIYKADHYSDNKKFNPWNYEEWNIPETFLQNNLWSTPTALLGAAYHDYFGRDVADKFNKYFNTDISPYILDGVPFAILAFVCDIVMHKDYISKLDPFFPLAMGIIQGFVVGCTAALGAYCGDETPKVQTHNELVNHDEIQDIIYES